MAAQTKIEWTDSTFSPWIGCTKVSPGCEHCYAERDWDIRRHRVSWGAGNPRARTSDANWKQPLRWNAERFSACSTCGWRGHDAIGNGECPDCGHETEPARRRVFCASLADIFDNEVDPAWRADLWALIDQCRNMDWLILTKRIGNALWMLPETWGEGWPHVWLGATVVNQEEADRDIRKLLMVPAWIRFLSIEPMLQAIDLTMLDNGNLYFHNALTGVTRILHDGGMPESPLAGRKVDWVICGGESGPYARPMHPDWARSLRDQCAAAGVPYLFKQWGEWAPRGMLAIAEGARDCPPGTLEDNGCGQLFYAGHGRSLTLMRKVGKRIAGRLLDGVEHNGYPGLKA